MNERKKVVGTLFFKEGKLLIDKPRKRPTYQMVGGSVEEFETVYEAAIRECYEELGKNAVFDPNKVIPFMDFDEIATSDQKTLIHMYIFYYEGELKGELSCSEEIENFMWFGAKDDMSILSNTLKNEIVPICIQKGLIR